MQIQMDPKQKQKTMNKIKTAILWQVISFMKRQVLKNLKAPPHPDYICRVNGRIKKQKRSDIQFCNTIRGRKISSSKYIHLLLAYLLQFLTQRNVARAVLRIRNVYPRSEFFHPGSRPEFLPSRIRMKEFKYFNPKKWFPSCRKYDPGR